MKESSYIEIFSLVLLFYLLSGFIAPERASSSTLPYYHQDKSHTEQRGELLRLPVVRKAEQEQAAFTTDIC